MTNKCVTYFSPISLRSSLVTLLLKSVNVNSSRMIFLIVSSGNWLNLSQATRSWSWYLSISSSVELPEGKGRLPLPFLSSVLRTLNISVWDLKNFRNSSSCCSPKRLRSSEVRTCLRSCKLIGNVIFDRIFMSDSFINLNFIDLQQNRNIRIIQSWFST